MDLNTITEVTRPKARGELAPWREGDAFLGGGTWLFSEPQPKLTRLIDLSMLGWQPLTVSADGLAIAATAAFGFLLDAIVLRRVIGQPQFAVVMLTLGMAFIFRAGAGLAWTYDSVGFVTPFTNRNVKFGSLVLGLDNISIIVGTLVLCGVLYLFFSRTRLGVAMQAASQNQLAAYYMGIPVRRIFSMIWAISAGVAAVAAVLVTPVSLIDVNMGFLGIKAFAAAVLGGFGSIPGAVIGGVIVGIVEQLSGYFLPAGFQEVTSNIVLLAVLILRPEGLFGKTIRKRV